MKSLVSRFGKSFLVFSLVLILLIVCGLLENDDNFSGYNPAGFDCNSTGFDHYTSGNYNHTANHGYSYCYSDGHPVGHAGFGCTS